MMWKRLILVGASPYGDQADELSREYGFNNPEKTRIRCDGIPISFLAALNIERGRSLRKSSACSG